LLHILILGYYFIGFTLYHAAEDILQGHPSGEVRKDDAKEQVQLRQAHSSY
jgi:hypothetical protein